MESEFYNIIFPDCKISTGTIDSWKTSNGGHLKCSGSQGSVTGFGAGGRDMFRGCIIIDDPHKVADIYSPAERDK